jgi:two-component system, NtrC family, response regulator AlgB
MAKLLVVDDEKNVRDTLGRFLGSRAHEVAIAVSGREALAIMFRDGAFDLVLSDWRMAEMNGLELLNAIKAKFPATIVILMTAYGTIENAVAAIKAGASDYVTKPFLLDQIQHAVDRALEVKDLRTQVRALRNSIDGVPLLTTGSALFQSLIETAHAAASSGATILLTGESGTGKNVLARQIHEWSSRRERPFVIVNCTTLSESLLESELFGHMKGSFTGAIKDKPGRLEAANGGSVLLDEIAELSPGLQSKFLRFLEDERFERVGGEQTIKVDARVIAATNRDLPKEINAERFRSDLYYRLNVISLRVPTLRERPEDILPLAEFFLSAASARNSRSGLQFSDEARRALIAYSWPGNIRELRNAIERAVVLSRGVTLRKDELPDILFQSSALRNRNLPEQSTLEQIEHEHIRRVLALAPTLEDAAATLGICISTLWHKRKRYHLDRAL